jgi:hypothetical protein
MGIGTAACAGLLYWLWPEVQAWAGRLTSADLTTLAPSPGGLMSVVAVGGLLAAATAVVAIRGMFAE